jgi:hypothetical protein
VNVGGDPERDDSGLPPADIEIPDDARELERDVQAYYRELRALRRRRRWGNLHRPLTRDGMVLPLLAGCLILALLTGTLLTLFAAGQTDLQPPGSHPALGATGSAAASVTPTAVPVRTLLPNVSIITAMQHSLRVRSLKPAVLTLVPAGCQCATTLQELIQQARQAGVHLYMIANGEARLSGLVNLALDQTGEDPTLIGYEKTNVLGTKYRATGVTAILVRADGAVSLVKRSLTPGVVLVAQFRQLTSTG